MKKCIVMLLLCSGCTVSDAFWNQKVDIEIVGLYNVSQMGLSGFGYIRYNRNIEDKRESSIDLNKFSPNTTTPLKATIP